ncbi:MAG: hypothetical protein ACOC53_08560 [Candidatus Saliniplasma sp.]
MEKKRERLQEMRYLRSLTMTDISKEFIKKYKEKGEEIELEMIHKQVA